MRLILLKKAFSLLELIVASVLVIIVILGIFAINSVLSNSNQDYGQRYSLKSNTQTTLNHILNNASEAIGSGITINGNVDQGILWGNTGSLQVGDAYSFCIHQDISATAALDMTTSFNSPATSPPYTTNPTRWLCYTYFDATNTCPINAYFPNCSSHQIWYCARVYSSSSVDQGAGTCASYDPAGASFNVGGTAAPVPKYLGTALSNPVSTISFNSTKGFSITLTNCLDNTQASTCGSTTNNPQQTLSGSVFPSQEGMQQS